MMLDDTFYIVKSNSDSIEGRGPMRAIAYFTDLDEAVAFAQGKGVMGVGPGEVHEASFGEHPHEQKIYGYRESLTGKWSYGFVDNRDERDLKNDPEFQEYLKLKRKFADG